MRPIPTLASRRLSWSRWWVLALMMFCLPLQGVLAVTMQMGMAVERGASPQGVHARHQAQPVLQSGAGVNCLASAAGSADFESASAGAGHQAHVADAPAGHAAHAPHDDHSHQSGRGDSQAASSSAVSDPSASSDSSASTSHCDAASSNVASSSDTHHGCSFCAQCCIGVALLATPLTIADLLPTETPPTAVPAALLERQPQTPDRPPKHDFV